MKTIFNTMKILPLLLLIACAPSKEISHDTDSIANSPDVSDVQAAPATPGYKDSFSACWADMTCKRVFVISHGGDWNLKDKDHPYDSKAAFARAWKLGADGIKTDFRVTKDKVGVVTHSSPIKSWESLDCSGRKVEEMTAAEVTACHIFPSKTQTFQLVADVIEEARGKGMIMLTVKDDNFARAVEIILEHQAEEYVFIETKMGSLSKIIPKAPDFAKVYYNAETGSIADIDTLKTITKTTPVLFCEMYPTYPDVDAKQMPKFIESKVHPLGMRAFVSSIDYPSEKQHEGLFHEGFDVIMSYNLENGIQARKTIHGQRGIDPP